MRGKNRAPGQEIYFPNNESSDRAEETGKEASMKL